MFLDEEIRIDLPVDAARHRMLVHLHVGGLQSEADGAVADARGSLMQAGVAGLTKQVQVLVRPAYLHGDAMVVPLRWVATGPTGALFPQLDANLEIAAASPTASNLRLLGSYRPPMGTLGVGVDRVVLHRVATATFTSFLRNLSDALLRADPAYDSYQETELSERG
jgi:hypothetical protein